MDDIAPNTDLHNSARRPDFFISRAGADAAFAAVISRILEDAGHPVILQQWDFANSNFMGQMHAALTSGARVIALLSPEYLRSEHCLAEALNHIAQDPLDKRRQLIVMRVVECASVGMFAGLAYWDLVPIRNNAAAVRDIVLAAIQSTFSRTAPASVYWRNPLLALHNAIRPVPNFTGRREDLAALESALWSGDAGATQAVAITQAAIRGLGGVGKSALSIQYAWKNRERYAGVWLINAQTSSDVIDGLVVLGARFIPGLGEMQDRAEAARAALGFIENGGFEKPWLLIYDNVERPDVLRGLTPCAGAQALITSRWQTWRGRATEVPLDVFVLDDAVRFLLAATGRTDAEGAARLAGKLGRLPLALDHAAAFCVEAGDSFDAYGERLAQWIKKAPPGADYPEPVFATFSLAIEKAAGECPEAERLMAIFAFMAANDIPRDIVSEEAMDAMALREAVAALRRVSLLTMNESGDGGPFLTVHRLTQAVMRGRVEARGEAADAAALAVTLVAEAFPIPARDVRNWPACERLYPHAMAALETAPETGEKADKTSLLLNQVGQYLDARADYGEAEPLMRRALAIDEGSYGPEHPDVAVHLNNLAGLLQATNRLAEAEPLMRRALAIDEGSYGPEHPRVAIDLNNLAQLLKATNRLAEAEPLMRRALAIDEASYGPEHPRVAIDLNNLAQLLQATNRLAEAEPLMRRALAIDEASYGPEHPRVAIDLNNLAGLLKATNRLAEAEPLMRRALAIDEASYGPEHPDVAIDLNNLAQLLKATNRLAEAEPLMRRALAIDEASYGPEHPRVAIDLNNLAQLLKATNRLAEAEPLMRRALAIDEGSYGPEHPRVAVRLNNLAGLLKATNRLAEAEPLMRRALAIDEASYGPEHPDVAVRLNNLAQLLQATNRLAEAEPLMRRALAIDEASYGPEHPDVAIDLNNLAQLLQATNRLAEAEPLMRRALAIDEASYGPEHPRVAIDLNNLAGLLKATNRLAEAEPLMRRALAIDEASYGPEHPRVAIDLNNLAGLLQATNRLAEAEPLMRRALAIDEASYGPEHPDVAIDLNNLAQLLKATNRLAEAEPLMRRALDIVEASLPDHHPWVQSARANLAAMQT